MADDPANVMKALAALEERFEWAELSEILSIVATRLDLCVRRLKVRWRVVLDDVAWAEPGLHLG